MQYSRESEIEGFQALPPHKRILKVLLSPENKQTKNISLGMTILDPSWSSSAHIHDIEEEIWFVVSGVGHATVGKDTIRIEPGTAICCPPGQSHQLINDGSEEMRVLWAFSPPGPEKRLLGRKGGQE